MIGSVAASVSRVSPTIDRLDFSWITDSLGTVGAKLWLPQGLLLQASIQPSEAAATMPNDGFSLALVDPRAGDVLRGAFSSAQLQFVDLTPGYSVDGLAPLHFGIANAGFQRAGIFSLWLFPPGEILERERRARLES